MGSMLKRKPKLKAFKPKTHPDGVRQSQDLYPGLQKRNSGFYREGGLSGPAGEEGPKGLRSGAHSCLSLSSCSFDADKGTLLSDQIY